MITHSDIRESKMFYDIDAWLRCCLGNTFRFSVASSVANVGINQNGKYAKEAEKVLPFSHFKSSSFFDPIDTDSDYSLSKMSRNVFEVDRTTPGSNPNDGKSFLTKY